MTNKKDVLIITPSVMVAKGIESILGDMGEFRVAGILPDLDRGNDLRLKNRDIDIVLLDPSVFGYDARGGGKSYFADFTDAPVLALVSAVSDEDILRSYDGCVTLFDAPNVIVRKLRAALETKQDSPKNEGNELSSREKEILICVAKGMLNKEIADLYNLSIYTVITHRKNITRKTGIKTVAGLTVYALLNNLIDINSVE